jgi:hypothetical protein
MKIKSLLLTAVLATAVLCLSPAGASAAGLTANQVQMIINLLQSFGVDSATIANVQTALNGGTPAPTPSTWCHTFNTNFGIGTDRNNAEFEALIGALQKEGTIASGTGLSALTSGGYDEGIASLVIQFQTKYGILKTGYVGPLTRAKLNKLYSCGITPPPTCSTVNNTCTVFKQCCSGLVCQPFESTTVDGGTCVLPSSNTQPSITITSPNGGEQWIPGSTHNINWTSTGLLPTDQIFIYAGSISSSGYMVTVSSIPGNYVQYNWNIPSNATLASNYYIKVYADRNGVTIPIADTQSNYFSIVAPGTAQPAITITSPNGSQTNSVNIGNSYVLRWNHSLLSSTNLNVTVTHSITGGPFEVFSPGNIYNGGSFSFTVPSDRTAACSGGALSTGGGYKVSLFDGRTTIYSGNITLTKNSSSDTLIALRNTLLQKQAALTKAQYDLGNAQHEQAAMGHGYESMIQSLQAQINQLQIDIPQIQSQITALGG